MHCYILVGQKVHKLPAVYWSSFSLGAIKVLVERVYLFLWPLCLKLWKYR